MGTLPKAEVFSSYLKARMGLFGIIVEKVKRKGRITEECLKMSFTDFYVLAMKDITKESQGKSVFSHEGLWSASYHYSRMFKK